MKKTIPLLAAWCSLSCIATFTSAAQDSEDAFVQTMLSRMTIEEKLGQLNQLDGRMDMDKLESMIRNGQITSLMNIVDPDEVDRLQKIAVEESRLGIPIIFSRDVIHGFKTMLPIPLGQAASFNPDLVMQGARMAALEATEHGIRWGFSPMIDVSRDSRWGRIAESFGEDPLLNATLGLSTVRGYQGDDMSGPTSIAACAKHFVGYGAGRGGRDYNGSDLTERELRDFYLPPFQKVLQGGCASVMTSFQDNDGLQASANKWLLTQILRDEWQWDGVVVSDYGSTGQLIRHGLAKDSKEVAAIALECGTDMEMCSRTYVRFVKKLIEDGTLNENQLDRSVDRILRMKYRLGLFDHPYSQKITHDTGCPNHLKTALEAARQSAVLLKNDGILPLDTDRKMTLLVTGPMADAAYDQLGTWDMDGDTTLTVTPKNAFLSRSNEKLRVIWEPGLEYSRDLNTDSWKSLRRKASKADAIIAVLGEEQILSGEAHSLANLDLIGRQKEFVRMLASTGKPVIAVIMAGRALTIAEEVEECAAVIYCFHPGTMGGEALAEIVTGEVNPSGKLPITVPMHVGQSPIYYNELRQGRVIVNEKARPIYEIPRSAKQSVLGHSCTYLDYGPDPLFPFGYGLSYTTFAFEDAAPDKKEYGKEENMIVKVHLSNTGKVAGDEVIQVYIRDAVSSVSRPVKELKAFRKVHLEAGQSTEEVIEIPISSFGLYNKDMQYVVEPGEFRILVSDCSNPDLCPSAKQFDITVK